MQPNPIPDSAVPATLHLISPPVQCFAAAIISLSYPSLSYPISFKASTANLTLRFPRNAACVSAFNQRLPVVTTAHRAAGMVLVSILMPNPKLNPRHGAGLHPNARVERTLYDECSVHQPVLHAPDAPHGGWLPSHGLSMGAGPGRNSAMIELWPRQRVLEVDLCNMYQ